MGLTLRTQGVKRLVTVDSWAQLESAYASARGGTVITLSEPDDPSVLTLNAPKPFGGVAIVMHPDQQYRVWAKDVSDLNVAVYGGQVSAFAVNGDFANPYTTGAGVYVENCSRFGLYNAVLGKGGVGSRFLDASDIEMSHILLEQHYEDCIRLDGCDRMRLANVYAREPFLVGKQILWWNNGTPPTDGTANTSNGTTSFWADTAHNDICQVLYPSTDITWEDFDCEGYGQGLFFDSSATLERGIIRDNRLRMGMSRQISMKGGDLQFIDNDMDRPSLYAGNPLLSVTREGGGKIWGGRNAVGPHGSATQPGGVDLLSGTLNGDADPAAPTLPNVPSLLGAPSLVMPTFVARSTPPEIIAPPLLYHTNANPGSPPTTGTWITTGVGKIAGFEGVTSQQWRWTKNGTPIGGQTARTYQVVSGDLGASIRCETRAQNAYGWSEWVASAPLVPA